MKSNKLKILAIALAAVLFQGSYVVYAASSSDKTYTKDELENSGPGWSKSDIEKNNYKVNSYTNTFSSTQTPNDEEDTGEKSTSTKTTSNTVESNLGNIIVSTSPSTGRKGDFWGKTKEGKWILIEQGVPASGWKNVKGKWYHMDYDGVMETGWINDGETWYYLNSDGSMAYNTYVGGYYLDWNGAMQE